MSGEQDRQWLVAGSRQPLTLLSQPRRRHSHNWMMQVLPVASIRDGLWLFHRSLPHPSRTLSTLQSTGRQVVQLMRPAGAEVRRAA